MMSEIADLTYNVAAFSEIMQVYEAQSFLRLLFKLPLNQVPQHFQAFTIEQNSECNSSHSLFNSLLNRTTVPL